MIQLNVALMILSIVCGCVEPKTDPLPQRQIGTVLLKVDFGGASPPIEVQIPCSEDSTVFDILSRAQLNGDLKLQSSGSAETAFVQSINGVGGQPSDTRYWTYLLNGQLSKTGSGITEVDPGDELQWRYGSAPPELTD